MQNRFHVDLFSNKEIDLFPVKKKRQRIEEYDYNDDFLESFEGETEAVELECKLENFFIYKGTMKEDSKKILKKYNNYINTTFDFEISLSRISKKDPKWYNFIGFLIFNTRNQYKRMPLPTTEQGRVFSKVRSYIDNYILRNSIDNDKNGDNNDKNDNVNDKSDNNNNHNNDFNNPSEEEINVYKESLKKDLNMIANLIKEILRNESKYKIKQSKATNDNLKNDIIIDKNDLINNYQINNDNNNNDNNNDLIHKNVKNIIISKLFQFNDNAELISYFLDFIVNYIRFYYLESPETVKNRCLACIYQFFPEDCTNRYRIKFCILQKIEEIGLTEGYDMTEVVEGRFIQDCI